MNTVISQGKILQRLQKFNKQPGNNKTSFQISNAGYSVNDSSVGSPYDHGCFQENIYNKTMGASSRTDIDTLHISFK